MKRPGYREAVKWIAENDSPGDDDPADELAGLVTVALVADLFGQDQNKVGQDVWNLRHPKA